VNDHQSGVFSSFGRCLGDEVEWKIESELRKFHAFLNFKMPETNLDVIEKRETSCIKPDLTAPDLFWQLSCKISKKCPFAV